MFYFNPTAPFLRKFDKDFEKKEERKKESGMEEAMEIHHDGQVHLTGTVPTLDWIDQSARSLYGVRRS
jgi:hypothetical protein